MPKKSTQKKGDPTRCDPFAALRGNLGRGAGGVGRRTHFAAAQLRSDNCGQSVHEAAASCGAAATPPAPRPRRIQKGVGHHTGHRCARPWVWGATDSDRLPNSTEPAQTQVSSLTSESEKGKRRWGAPSWKAASAAATRPDVDRTSLHPGRAQRWPELDFPPLWTCREAQRVRRAGAPKDAHAS